MTLDVQTLYQSMERWLELGSIPGLSLALLDAHRPGQSKTWGVCHCERRQPVAADTVFEAASLSKPVFAYIALQLVEAGRLDLDRPLADYWAYEDIAHDPRHRHITGRMTLSHTCGFPNWRPKDGGLTIDFAPGEKFSYSGEGFVYLQKVVEFLTGQTLQTLAQERIFRPLGMIHSSFVWPDGRNATSANGHDEDGRPVDKRQLPKGNAAYTLHTTATDYAHFMAEILRPTGLSSDWVQQMLAPQVEIEPGIAWGLGWGLQERAGGRDFWHWGDNGPFKAFALAAPAQGNGLVLFANSYHGLSIVHRVLAESLGGAHPAVQWIDYPAFDAAKKQEPSG